MNRLVTPQESLDGSAHTAMLQDVGKEGPLATPDLGRRAWPFLAVMAFVFAIGPIGATTFDRQLWLLAGALLVALVTAGWRIPWRRLPRWTQTTIPLLTFPVLLLLREATGGPTSGITGAIVPLLWIAMYCSPRTLVVGVVLLAGIYVLPLAWDGRSIELELRRALTSVVINGSVAWAVQRMVRASRRTRSELEQAVEREQQVAAELRELAALKSGFVAMASHELRTPLASVYGFSNTLLHRWDELDEQQRQEFTALIERESSRLAALIDDVLVLSRIEQGSLSPHREDMSLRPAIDAAIATAGIGGVQVSCPDDTRVFANDMHVQRMLVNYLTNAQKYGEAPFLVRVSPNGSAVDLHVVDHGYGVNASFVPRLFEEFQRDNGSQETPGTGLGLSIVRGLARAHGGDAWWEPNQPTGSVFALRLLKATTE